MHAQASAHAHAFANTAQYTHARAHAHMHGNTCAPMDPAAEATCSDGCMSIVALPLRRRRARMGAASLGSLVDHERFAKVGRVPNRLALPCVLALPQEGAVPPTHSRLQGRRPATAQSVHTALCEGGSGAASLAKATVPKGFKGTGEPESTGATYCAWHRIE
jgi:predicted nucleic acid-binding Zn ribbon protein